MARESRFRAAAPASAWRNVVKTALQCALIWPAFLLVLPALLIAVEPLVGAGRFHFPGQAVAGVILFAGFTALNLATGGVLAVRGRGTPLPLDCPNDLVVTGPYAYVRNPMAIAGLGQGAAIAVGVGSWLVLAYVLAGAAVWQLVLRPVEERDLALRFGAAYERYHGAVGCWRPRLTPYRTAASDGRAAAP
jgi:protein-S-isoprenylcysteine O-methyltransferase Ste14